MMNNKSSDLTCSSSLLNPHYHKKTFFTDPNLVDLKPPLKLRKQGNKPEKARDKSLMELMRQRMWW